MKVYTTTKHTTTIISIHKALKSYNKKFKQSKHFKNTSKRTSCGQREQNASKAPCGRQLWWRRRRKRGARGEGGDTGEESKV